MYAILLGAALIYTLVIYTLLKIEERYNRKYYMTHPYLNRSDIYTD